MVKVISREFSPGDLVGGHCALDFVNTVTARNTAEPRDWLDSYDRLLEWAELAGIIDGKARATLSKRAAAPAAARALTSAKQLREALHNVYSAIFSWKRVPQADLKIVDLVWRVANERSVLRASRESVIADVDLESSGLDYIRDRVAREAVELLRELPMQRARICRGDACGWLFIDTSKGGKRIWCDMAVCGNVAKSRRHLARRATS